MPEPDSATARSTACSSSAARNRQVGPEPETSEPSAPYSSPSCEGRAAAPAAAGSAAACEVVVQRRADGVRVAGAQRGHQVLGHRRLRRPRLGRAARAGRARRRRRASTARRRRTRAPSRSVPARQHRRDVLAAAGAERGAADQAERHVAAELGRQSPAARRAWRRSPTARRRRPARRPRRRCRRPGRRRPGSSCGCCSATPSVDLGPPWPAAAPPAPRGWCRRAVRRPAPSPVTVIVNVAVVGRPRLDLVVQRRRPGRPWRPGGSRRARRRRPTEPEVDLGRAPARSPSSRPGWPRVTG